MAIVQWKKGARSGNPLTLLSTELNNLGNGAGAISSEISNDAADELDLYVDLELAVTFGTAPTADSLVRVFIVRQIDGTNYETNSTEGRPRDGYVGGFVLDNVTTAQRIILRRVELPPEDFKVYVINDSDQSFPASGSTIKGFFYTVQVG